MKRSIYTGVLLFIGLALCTVSCELPIFPDQPSISFKEIKSYSVPSSRYNPPRNIDSLVIRIDFKDGDGDLGLAPTDTEPPFNQNNPDNTPNPFYNNYRMVYYKKMNGEFVPATNFGIGSEFRNRFPVLRTDGKTGPIEGTLDLSIYIYPPLSSSDPFFIYPNDTLKFEIQIWDRKLNASNIVTSSEVVVLRR